MIKMLKLYNEYFFDAKSVEIDNTKDIPIRNLDDLVNKALDCRQYDDKAIVENQHSACMIVYHYTDHESKIVK